MISRRSFLLATSFSLIGLLGLTSCDGASQSYVKINGEELSLDKLGEIIKDNELTARKDYVGKDIEVCAPLVSVSSPGNISVELDSSSYYSHDCPYGWVSIGTKTTRYLVELEESDVEIAAGFADGDTIRATGVFSGFNALGYITEICLFTTSSTQFDGGPVNGAATHLEKLD
ncbi:hypothetical protein VXJ24_08685 [Olsenella sp. YH-ols2221]|uniref:hypothetical protein n=1 Tax=Olsenella kribbiana TaxID=3115221 RepID=UPI002ED8E26A